MTEYDLHIRGGMIVDGMRSPRYRGDVFIKDGKIAQLGGRSHGGAKRVIDAEGHIVAPGFVDVHTHYDAQIFWDPWCTISGWHGVTSVVLGNCGIGFAPVRADFRDRTALSMTRVEAIPYDSIRSAMPWDWESMPEFLQSLRRIPKGVNCAQFMPVGQLMIYVMGLEAARSRPATKGEREEMARLLNEGMDAGLCGFSVQRLGPNSTQSDYDGSPIVTDTMCDDDVLNLARVLHDRDEGCVEITQFTGDHKADYRFREELARTCRRPVLHNIISVNFRDPTVHMKQLKWLEDCHLQGLPMYGQGATGRTGFAFTLEDWNLYDASPSWKEACVGTREEKLRKMSSSELRKRMKDEEGDRRLQLIQHAVGGPIKRLVVNGVGSNKDMQNYIGRTVGEIATSEGKHPIDAMLDIAVASDLKAEYVGIPMQFDPAIMSSVVLDSSYTLLGASDGGAHTKFFNGGAYTTDLLMWLVRDEKRISLEDAHYKLSALPAHVIGLRDRGILREGSPADVVVYDLDALEVDPMFVGKVVHDQPGNEWRRVQTCKGYRAIIVNGEVTFENGICTGATPGEVLRVGRRRSAGARVTAGRVAG